MNFLIVDCETTGLENADEPISIGAMLCHFTESRIGEVIETYYSEQEPSRPISYEAESIHRISASHVRGKKFDVEAFKRLVLNADIVVAHNARFDARMLCKVAPEILNKEWRCSFNQLSYPLEMKRESLDRLCFLLKIERAQPHNALKDCEVLLKVLNQRLGTTIRSNTPLGRIFEEPNWRVFSSREPMLRLDSTNNIIFSEINEPSLLECTTQSPIQLWTKDHLDFVIGYFRYGNRHGRQGELFRFLKSDNPHVTHETDESHDYFVVSFEDHKVIIGPRG